MPTDPPVTSLDKTLRDFVPDQKVFGRYRLVRILGRGGMGIVWLAHDDQLDREVALKFLPEIIVHDRAVVEDLKHEAKRCLELTHKNIIRIHDFIQDTVSACISMEYIEGDTLSNLRADKATRIFESDELNPWLSQLCEALDYAHNQARIIHRDLKPSNLIISKRGQLKIADFGIARSLSDSVSMLTHSTGTSGTLVYMSPQQLDGLRATHLDDIYSIGATLYELLTSKPPFYSGDIAQQIRERVPSSMMQRRADLDIEGNPIPKNWEQIIAGCLEKDPAKRPQGVMDMAWRVGLLKECPGKVAPAVPTALPPPVALTKRNWRILLATGAIVLLLAVLAGWWFGVEQPQRRAKAERPAESPAAASHPAPAPVKTDRLVRDAVALRDKGDTTNALAKLYQATEREPKNPKVLEEMAKTYEAMQLFDRSSDTWQKILDIGPATGPSYDLALARLKSGVSARAPAASPAVETATKPVVATAPPRQSAPTGQLLTIPQVRTTQDLDLNADTNLTLWISVKKQPDVVIDRSKVRIQVYFYETVDELGTDIRLTDLQPTHEWGTRKPDWATNEPAVLSVNYVRPKNKVTSLKPTLWAPSSEIGKRRYLGYIVRVFYNDELQAEKADPQILLKRFPASAPAFP